MKKRLIITLLAIGCANVVLAAECHTHPKAINFHKPSDWAFGAVKVFQDLGKETGTARCYYFRIKDRSQRLFEDYSQDTHKIDIEALSSNFNKLHSDEEHYEAIYECNEIEAPEECLFYPNI